MPPCDGDGEGWLPWSTWSDCDESGQQYRKRYCSVRNPMGMLCLGTDKESRICYNIETAGTYSCVIATSIQRIQYGVT